MEGSLYYPILSKIAAALFSEDRKLEDFLLKFN